MSVRSAVPFAVALASTLGCMSGEDTTADVTPEPSCDLTTDNLVGRTFLRQLKGDDGKYEPDVLARVQFVDDGGALKARYTVRSLNSVYSYSCTKDEKKDDALLCLQDDPDVNEFCRALWANVGACEETQLLAVLGLPTDQPAPDNVKAAVKKIEEETKKLKKDDLEKMKTAYNSPNVQLRGILKVKVKASEESCYLNISDLYETFSFGQRREMENLVGTARFAETDKPYVFEHCVDTAGLVAMEDPAGWANPGESIRDWEVGKSATFRYVGPDGMKPESGCTYSMDTFFAYEPVGTQVPVETDDKGRLNWSFTRGLSTKGKHQVAHVYRYKTCGGGEPERVGVSCTAVQVGVE